MSDVLSQLRDAAAEVSRRARHVRVNEGAIPAYARSLPRRGPAAGEDGGGRRDAAFWLTLDAINFGSGWFPTLRKSPGKSGYRTIAAGLMRHFDTRGPWTAHELQRITPDEIAETLSQDPDHELMALFAASLNDLGDHVAHDFAGQFEAAATAAGAVALVERLASWACFDDVSAYALDAEHTIAIPFLKRAQIAAADLARAGLASFGDLARLTMFADNLVPHVLRLDGILTFDPALVARIRSEELIEHGSPEEVEIRACAVHAVELIAAARPSARAADIDQLLWLRGQEPRYKASPRHRSRCTAY